MLAAIEDLLDTFPGTLLVVSHDRYLVERVTDQQYAVMDGGFRHLPRGVDQYLELRAAQQRAGAGAPSRADTGAAPVAPKLGGAELRNTQKEYAAAGRKITKLNVQIAELHERMASHDQSDYTGLGALATELAALEENLETVEFRALELEELLGI